MVWSHSLLLVANCNVLQIPRHKVTRTFCSWQHYKYFCRVYSLRFWGWGQFFWLVSSLGDLSTERWVLRFRRGNKFSKLHLHFLAHAGRWPHGPGDRLVLSLAHPFPEESRNGPPLRRQFSGDPFIFLVANVWHAYATTTAEDECRF